ncbi:MAG: hypothetical protein H6618_07040 [Deltaproteobacteria bacterium]|nr:hypothetical protein [Deltaproteobacteria bacterium]
MRYTTFFILLYILTGCRLFNSAETRNEHENTIKDNISDTLPATSGNFDEEFVDISQLNDAALKNYRLCSESEFEPLDKNISYFLLKEKARNRTIHSKEELAQLVSSIIQSNKINSGFLLAYETNSLQSASPEFPRLIRFTSTDSDYRNKDIHSAYNGEPSTPLSWIRSTDPVSFIIAFSGFEGEDLIEILEFNEKHQRFCARIIKIEDQKIIFKDHPQSCVRCHRDDLRPNWEGYPLWPGFFGSMLFNQDKESYEYQMWKTFYEKEHTDDIYASVNLKPKKNILLNENGSYTESESMYPIDNEFFSGHVQYTNFFRIARILKEEKSNESYRYAILAALSGCPDIETYLPAHIREQHTKTLAEITKETTSLIKTDIKDRLERIKPYADRSKPYPNPGFTDEESVDAISAFRYLMEYRKHPVSLDLLSLSFKGNPYSFKNYTLTIHDIVHYYAFLLQEEIGPFEDRCSLLKDKSLQNF